MTWLSLYIKLWLLYLYRSVDWNNTAIVNKLYSIFQGTVFTKGGQQPSQIKPEQKRKAASVQLRMKIFPYLLKSREAANQFPACVQVGLNLHAYFMNSIQFVFRVELIVRYQIIHCNILRVITVMFQIVFDCLYGTNTNQKLKAMAVQFVHHLCFK